MASLLGGAWATAQQQGNGQPAFETKAAATTSCASNTMLEGGSSYSNTGLASLFSLLRICAEHCPYILLNLKDENTDDNDIGNGHDNSVLLIRRALDSAVSSLLDPQYQVCWNSIAFLESIMDVLTRNSFLQEPQHVEEFRSRICPSILCTLLMGCTCGKIVSVALPDACRLLIRTWWLMSSNTTWRSSEDLLRSLVLQSLSSDCFLLGEEARATVLMYLCSHTSAQNRSTSEAKTTTTTSTSHEFERMVTQLWELHQHETPQALQNSDVVRRFCIQYQG
mmetsp:Transcript_20608/g.38566  ORF Transcript_20608/g.38566 Transcript_20608/m.38566 type:complete len:280 (+) Transcript_20608:314-1153(+)